LTIISTSAALEAAAARWQPGNAPRSASTRFDPARIRIDDADRLDAGASQGACDSAARTPGPEHQHTPSADAFSFPFDAAQKPFPIEHVAGP
jgi:hypothetical protein